MKSYRRSAFQAEGPGKAQPGGKYGWVIPEQQGGQQV